MLFMSNTLKITSFKIIQAKRSFVNVGTGSQELVILSYATVCLHPCVSLNNQKICREISEHKIAVCEKTAGLRNGNFGFELISRSFEMPLYGLKEN